MWSFISRIRRTEPPRAIAEGASQAVRATGIHGYRESRERLGAEIARARRYDHRLAVLAIGPETDQLREVLDKLNGGSDPLLRIGHDLRMDYAQLVFFQLGSLLRDTVRQSDILTYDGERHLYVVFLPESEATGARSLVRRLNRLFDGRSPMRLRAGIAEFPRDGLTTEDLLSAACDSREGEGGTGEEPPLSGAMEEVGP